MEIPVHVLFVSSDTPDNTHVHQSLEREPHRFQVFRVHSSVELDNVLKQQPRCDLVVSACEGTGLEPLMLLQRVHQLDPEVPVLFIIEPGHEKLAVDVMKQGASGYVFKSSDFLRQLPYTIRVTLECQTLRRCAEEALSWESDVNAALAELSRALILEPSIAEISKLILDHAKCFTQSQYGDVGSPGEKPRFHEGISTTTPLERVLTVPAMIGDNLLGQISVANANHEYTDRDRAVLERLADLYALALERYQREEEVRQLSIAVDQSATVIMITDLDGNLVFVNRSFEKATGYTRAEVLGQNPRFLKTRFLSQKAYQQLWTTISQGGVWEGEFFNRRKDGSTYWEKAVITPIKDANGDIIRYMAVKEDITHRKIAEEALKKAKEEAEAVSRLKSEFLANISHEIRTPMNAILGFTDLLEDTENDPAKLQQLAIVKESGQQLLKILTDVLDFAKLESGKIEIHCELFGLPEMLNRLYQRFLPQVQKQQLQLILDIDAQIPAMVHGDKKRIEQVLNSVVSNAVKFTMTGHIAVHCEYQQQWATFCITDTGIGIPAEKLTHVFAPFAQGDASATRHHNGAGLGLAITQKLVKLMGGTVSLESQFGGGTTVMIALPLPAASTQESAGQEEKYVIET